MKQIIILLTVFFASLAINAQLPNKSKWKIWASSVEKEYCASNAIDNDLKTRWSSHGNDNEWLIIDLGEKSTVCGVRITWERAYADSYSIKVSNDDREWRVVRTVVNGHGGTDDLFFAPTEARYIRFQGIRRSAGYWGYSMFNFEIRGLDQYPLAGGFDDDGKIQDIFDGNLGTGVDISAGSSLVFDFRKHLDLSGVRFDWGKGYPKKVSLYKSEDAMSWQKIAEVDNCRGVFDYPLFSAVKVRFIKAQFDNESRLNLKEMTLRSSDQEMTAWREYALCAEKAPKGLYPLPLYRKQAYWTVVGRPSDSANGIINEFGAIEPYKKSCSIEPFLFMNKKIITSSDVDVEQSLNEGYLPLPIVKWNSDSYSLDIKTFSQGLNKESASLYVKYELKNKGTKSLKGKLLLAIRPLQITPPWQFGGSAPIEEMSIQDRSNGQKEILINEKKWCYSLSVPNESGASSFLCGDVVEKLRDGIIPTSKYLKNQDSRISGVLSYEYDLLPGEKKVIVICLAMHDSFDDIKYFNKRSSNPEEAFDICYAEQINFWKEKLDKVIIKIPNQDIINTVKAQIGYVLVNRNGHSTQPGSRNYNRAWIRDGSLTCAALLRFGLFDEVKDYLDWYALRVTSEGWVPPILENNGNINDGYGSKNEWDSQGEFVYTLAEYYRFTKDKAFLKKHYNKMINAMKYAEKLRQTTMVAGYMSSWDRPERFQGILPAGISHEGFPSPHHSYWDDFWAMKGWKDLAYIAKEFDDISTLNWADQMTLEWRKSILKSLDVICDFMDLDYIPNNAENGGPDATSLAIAFFPCDEAKYLNKAKLEKSFLDFYNHMIKRFDPSWPYSVITYENRSIFSFSELGWDKKAEILLENMMTYRRPQGWLHWAEVVHMDYRKGEYIGDMPHTWVGAGFVNSVRGLVMQEKKDKKLILFKGMPPSWFKNQGLKIENMPTYFGKIDVSAQIVGNNINILFNKKVSKVEKLKIYIPWIISRERINARDELDNEVNFDLEGNKIMLVPSNVRKITIKGGSLGIDVAKGFLKKKNIYVRYNNGMLTFKGENIKKISIINLSGSILYSNNKIKKNCLDIKLDSGLYLLRTNKGSEKFIVK